MHSLKEETKERIRKERIRNIPTIKAGGIEARFFQGNEFR